jgi:hypothetical protein
MASEPENTRDQQGRWARGRSGNARGRPVGARNRATVACEDLLAGEAEAITRVAIEKAKAGDVTSLRLCVERIIPLRKGRPVNIDLPEVETTADLPPLISRVIRAVAEGEITPEEGASLGSMIEQAWRSYAMADTEARLRALEERRGRS